MNRIKSPDRNADLKRLFREHEVYQWQVAEFYGTSEYQFSKLLRYKLEPEEVEKIVDASQKARMEYA